MTRSSDNPIRGELTVDYPEAGGVVAPYAATPNEIGQFMGIEGELSLDNFDGSDEQKWLLESTACDGDAIKSNKSVNNIVPVKYWYMQKVTITNKETGEVSDCIRTALITPSGEVYAFVSAGVAMSIARMAKRFGRKPFDPPRRMRVESRPVSNGKSMLVLVPVPSSEE